MPATPLPNTLGAAFGVGEARQAGVSAGRLRAKDLEAPHRGVRMRRTEPAASVDDSPLARDRLVRARVMRKVAAYEEIRRPHAFYLGRTAVAIYDRLFDDDSGDGPLMVAVFAPHRAPRCRGVRGVQSVPGLTTLRHVGGLPVASPASVWAGLAEELGLRALIRLGDALVRIPRGDGGAPLPHAQLATIGQLQAAAEAPRRRARHVLEHALRYIRVGSMSVMETDFRVDAQDAGLPEPQLDVEIRDAGGRLLGIADAAYPEFRVLVEVEGQQHRTSDDQWERDLTKHAAYAAAGWEVVRVTGRRVRRGQAVPLVRAVLRRHGWEG
ncbi:hypothetical protein [Microbacterium sp.]|uniref:hypothetical protein n=1 Tax=Microbacterium sp. TaxID=51671 RepID=UPI0039E4820B